MRRSLNVPRARLAAQPAEQRRRWSAQKPRPAFWYRRGRRWWRWREGAPGEGGGVELRVTTHSHRQSLFVKDFGFVNI